LEPIDIIKVLTNPDVMPHITRDNVVRLSYEIALQSPRTYAMLDHWTAGVVADLVDQEVLVLSEGTSRRAKSATAAAGVLGKLPLFKAADIDDLIGIRDELSESLPRFRAGMNRLSSEFANEAYSDAFFDDVEDAWLSTVEPAVQEIRETVSENRFLRRVAMDGFANPDPLVGAGVGVVTAIASHNPLAGAVTGVTSVALSVASKAFSEKKQANAGVRRSEFYLLYRIDELLRKRAKS
jgi:hypothetical protein